MLRPRLLTAALVAALIGVAPRAAASDAPDDSAERARIEIESTLASLNERGLLTASDGTPIALRAPAQQRWELGAVLDLAAAGRDGPRVLAVTPDGPAARMGLRVDDRVTRVNGTGIRGGAGAAARLLGALGARDGALEVDVERGGETLRLLGDAGSLAVPAYNLTVQRGAAAGSDCGRIDVYPTRRTSQQVFPIVLHAINGRRPGADRQFEFKLAPGRHVLLISERIDDVRIGNERLRDQLVRQNKDRREFVIDVEPGMTYRVGARFIVEKRSEIESGGYWEPVVWRQFGERCTGAVFASPAAAH